jgi:hypothetical protein
VTFVVVRGFQNWVFRSLIGVLRNILLSPVTFAFLVLYMMCRVYFGMGWDWDWDWDFGGLEKDLRRRGDLLFHVGIFYFSGGCCFVQAPEKCGFDARLGAFEDSRCTVRRSFWGLHRLRSAGHEPVTLPLQRVWSDEKQGGW